MNNVIGEIQKSVPSSTTKSSKSKKKLSKSTDRTLILMSLAISYNIIPKQLLFSNYTIRFLLFSEKSTIKGEEWFFVDNILL